MTRTRLDEVGYLKSEFAAKAAVKNFHCPHCKNPVGLKAGWLVITNREVVCDCGLAFDIFSVLVILSPENPSWKYLKTSEVLGNSWFHATMDGTWERILQRKTPLPIHLGTENAAFDRALCQYISQTWEEKPFHLYELKLKPHVKVAGRILHDKNLDKLVRGSDVTRYINRWEEPSSISLLAKTSAFEVISKRTVSTRETLERISIYNVAP